MPGNGQALLGLPGIDMLNIININSKGTEQDGGNDNCWAKKADSQSADMMQETDRTMKCYTNTDCISKSDNADKPTVNSKLSNTVDYFLQGPSCGSDKKASAEITQQLQRYFEDVFNAIGCFDDTFSLQLTPECKLYQAPPDVWHTCYKNLLKRN